MILISGENVTPAELRAFVEDTFGQGLTDNFSRQSFIEQAANIPGVTPLASSYDALTQ